MGGKITLNQIKSDVVIDRWKIREEERQRDNALLTYHQERDGRRHVAQAQMLALLQQFLSEDIDLGTFRTVFDRRTRKEWDVFGLKGMSGAMFLNTLVKHIPDQTDVAQRLRRIFPLPADVAEGRVHMQEFYDYLQSLIEAKRITLRQVQASRVPFFVGAWWHLQDPETWPVYYTSGRRALEQDGLFQSTPNPISDYFNFRNTYIVLMKALGISPWELEHLLGWQTGENREPDVPPKPDLPIVDTEELQEVVAITEAVDTLSHTHIQLLLAQIGRKLGCRVWIAANDHNRIWREERLGDLSIPQLPSLGLDTETQKIISLIDVIWVQGAKQVAAAFEIEHTTSIYSGLLRLSDLVALAPNLNFPLYIVTPESRIEKVRRELSRPTFQTLSLHEICKYFSFEELEAAAEGIMNWANAPSAIDKLAKKVKSVSYS